MLAGFDIGIYSCRTLTLMGDITLAFPVFIYIFFIPLVNIQTPRFRLPVFEKIVQNSADAESLGLDLHVTCSASQRDIALSHCLWDF